MNSQTAKIDSALRKLTDLRIAKDREAGWPQSCGFAEALLISLAREIESGNSDKALGIIEYAVNKELSKWES